MGRPKMADRNRVRTYRLTVKIDKITEDKLKHAAVTGYDGNASLLVRALIDQYLSTQEQRNDQPIG